MSGFFSAGVSGAVAVICSQNGQAGSLFLHSQSALPGEGRGPVPDPRPARRQPFPHSQTTRGIPPGPRPSPGRAGLVVPYAAFAVFLVASFSIASDNGRAASS